MNIPLKEYWNLLYNYLKPQWQKSLLLAFLLLSSIGLQLANPQILRYFIDTALSGGTLQTLVTAALLFLGVGLANQLFSTLATYLGADVGWTATNLIRADLAHHCLTLDMPFHNARSPGELIERIDGDVTALANFFSQFVVRVFGSMLLLFGALVLLFREDWRVGLILSLFTFFAVLLMNRIRDIAVAATTAEREATAKKFGFLEERLAGLDDIRANGGGPYVMQRFFQVTYEWTCKGRRAWVKRSTVWLFILGLFILGDIMAFGLGIYLFRAGVITVGTVYLFFQYTEMLRAPLEQITQQMQELQRAGASIGRIRELLALEPQIKDGWGSRAAPGPLALQFEEVSFGYGEGDPVLRGISFHLEPGRVLGLLGRTGSGKTTLTRLLLRLYEVNEGLIRIGGTNIRAMRLAELRRHVGMVTQEVQLFHATVRENLTFFDDRIPDERILEVIEELGLADWYRNLPEGLDTMLDAGGKGLSAGEAQLLAFTRVFLRDPGLVILDEPSSRLDPATERLIERAVDKLLRDRSCIIIAHRLATVERADEIMIMEDGKIVEHGRREWLARDPHSRFYDLLQNGLEELAA